MEGEIGIPELLGLARSRDKIFSFFSLLILCGLSLTVPLLWIKGVTWASRTLRHTLVGRVEIAITPGATWFTDESHLG
jgi:hypothetical protein